MKASEVLKRYQAGERDFKNVNLRGQFFFNSDLAGADFSHTDIRETFFIRSNLTEADFSYADVRGTHFTETNLKGAKFTKAKAGLTTFHIITSIISCWCLLGLPIFFNAYNYATAYELIYQTLDMTPIYWFIAISLILIILGIYCFFLFRQGISSRSSLAFILFLAVALSTSLIQFRSNFGNEILTVGFSIAYTVVFFVTLTIACSFLINVTLTTIFLWEFYSVINIILVTFFYVILTTLLYVGIYILVYSPGILQLLSWLQNYDYSNQEFAQLIINLVPERIFIVISLILIIFAFSLYFAYRAYREDKRDTWLRGIGLTLAAYYGTNFFDANLTDADFSQATLKNTNFRNVNLTRTCFRNSKKLELARLGGTILSETSVRKLVVDGNGYKQDYTNANIRGVNLNGANLEGAILKNVDLSEASLVEANLQAANLTGAQAVGTNFTKAKLTGACLEAWNIDATTILTEIDCLWVYLVEKEQPKSNQWGERRPSSSREEFKPGEFTKLFTEILNTVDLIFENGVDWKAFVTAFDKVRIENEDLNLTIRSIENLDDGMIVIKVNVPPEANKESLHNSITQKYQQAVQEAEKYKALLGAKEQESDKFYELSRLLASNQPNFINQTIMNDNTDQSQKINVKGNFTIDADNSVINLRDISGNVNNTIQQLPETTSEEPGIKELLMQLQTAIETETELDDKDKAKALKQVQKLAAAAENPQANQDDADDSLTMLKGIISGLKKTANLVTTCQKIIPLLTNLFGLV